MALGPIDWAAIVGAAAWVPQVSSWIARRIITSRVRLVPDNAPEIGFTSLGPILNLRCAISAERKDAIIERITCSLTQEKGQVTLLTWSTLNETFSQVRSAQGETAEYSKNQPAIALKVGTTLLAEKLIGFNDLGFQKEVRAQTAVAAERLTLLRETSDSNPEDTLLKSKEFSDLVALWERAFPWQEGRYVATFSLSLAGVKKPTEQALSFRLSGIDIKRLRANLAEVARYQRELVKPPEEPKNYNWHWQYPEFEH